MTAVDDIADLLRRTYTVYARNVPPIHDTVIAVLEEGGTVGKENIRIDIPFITVYVRSQSERQTLDICKADRDCRPARVTQCERSIPGTVGHA